MTRKDYRLIADAIKSEYCGSECDNAIINRLCVVLKADNVNFKPDTFRKACGQK